jgi:hypothetical protein
VLVEPYADHSVGKLTRLEAARKYLNVPNYEVVFNSKVQSVARNAVTKSLSGAALGEKVLYTTKVDTSLLDPSYLWFLKDLIEGPFEVTVAVVRNKLFGYKLRRDHPGSALDWREFISEGQQWQPYVLSEQEEKGIRCVMIDLRLHYARFDFILDRNNVLQFCELNPNGQFAWLDLEDTNRLISAVLEEISPNSDIFPIPAS